MFRFFVIIFPVVMLAGCSSSEKLLKDATPSGDNGALAVTDKKVTDTTSNSNQVKANTPMYQTPPALTIDQKKKYSATLTTSKGIIEIELFADKTPQTVNNFVFLSKENFYNGVIFHRTIPDFMIQGGDPTGTGSGGPGYQFNDEPFTGEYIRGTVAMANAGPDTNGSQFFIMHKDVALPKDYVIFGRVTSGMEVVDAIATAPTQPGGEGSTPVTPVVIESVKITEE